MIHLRDQYEKNKTIVFTNLCENQEKMSLDATYVTMTLTKATRCFKKRNNRKPYLNYFKRCIISSNF